MSRNRVATAPIERACPGPGTVDGVDYNECPMARTFKSPLAHRCQSCAAARNMYLARGTKRRQREKMRQTCGVKRPGVSKVPKSPIAEPRRSPVKRCRVCLGTPHLREQGREDESGVPVCLPGMARCRLCWCAYAPLVVERAVAVLGSSAASAAGAAQW